MAHTFDTSAQIAAATTNPQAADYTCGAGATLLVASLIYANGTRTGAPTYNSVALTQADQVRKGATSPEACAELWYMLDPPTGSAYSLSVPNTNGLSLEVCISSYKAASGKTSFYGACAGRGATGTNPYATIITLFDNSLIVACVASGADDWAPSARTGTQLYDTDNVSWGGGHQYYTKATAGSQMMSWTFGTTEDYGVVAACFDEIGIGVNVSKGQIYSVLTPPVGVSVSKAVIYAVLGPPAPPGPGGSFWPIIMRLLNQ